MKKIITLLTIVSSILFLSLPVSALDQKKEIIKLDNGYYLETIIEETSMARAANQKTARKTANYKNAQGAIMFSVTVTGTLHILVLRQHVQSQLLKHHLKIPTGKFLQKALPSQEIKLLLKQ